VRLDVFFGVQQLGTADVQGRVVAVIDVLLTTVTPVANVPPSWTVAPARKPVPLMVTAVPPLVVPDVGLIALTVGAGFPPPPCPAARKVTICMTQGAELVRPVAL